MLLQACDRRSELTGLLISNIDDRRHSGKVHLVLVDVMRQPLYAIGCGYPSSNHADHLKADSIQKLLSVGARFKGEDLVSRLKFPRPQDVFSRVELYRMEIALFDTMIERHHLRLKRRVKSIPIARAPTGNQKMVCSDRHDDI